MTTDSLARWFGTSFLGLFLLAVFALPSLTGSASPLDSSALEGEAPETDGDTPSPTDDAAHILAEFIDQSRPTIHRAVADSSARADQAALCDQAEKPLDEIRELIHYQNYSQAHRLNDLLTSADCSTSEELRGLALFQGAYLAHVRGDHDDVVDLIDQLDMEVVPVEDYALWLRGLALRELDRPHEAAEDFASIVDLGDSPLQWRALAQRSKSLVDAEAWEQALPIVDELLDRFPDYPRRHKAMLHRAQILDGLDQPDVAAEAFQEMAFRFPYKPEADIAQARLQQLEAAGHTPAPIDPETRFEHYTQLSILKFWELAHHKLTTLREEIRTESGASQLENKILERLALNTYQRHDHAGAEELFGEARRLYNEGYTRGFNRRTVFRYHHFALARIGRFDEAIEPLAEFHKDSPRRTRHRAFGQFYERYGNYEEAYDNFDIAYTAAQKRQWHFSYLKYKTGRFEEAYDNFRRLARLTSGQRRAQYLYWAARSLERGGEERQAAQLFNELQASRPNGYYGLQAANRLLDLEQRATVDESLFAQTERVSQSADAVFDAFDQASFDANSGRDDAHADPRANPISSGAAGRTDPALYVSPWYPALDEHCRGEGCQAPFLGFPFPTYGLSWQLGQPLIDPLVAQSGSLPTARDPWPTTDDALHDAGASEPSIPGRQVDFGDRQAPRIGYHTEARIYWNGRRGSEIGFANYRQGDMIGPLPDDWTAYDDYSHHGGLQHALDEAGDLFPDLKRVHWLWTAGWYTEARRVLRPVAQEYRSLSTRSRPTSSPHELPQKRWGYLIDNRRHASRADYWGMDDDEPLFPIPDDRDARRELLERQRSIHSQRQDLRPLLIDAFQEVGDYHMVRRFALDDTWWLREDPQTNPEARRYWMMAYPRAFPEQVIPLAEKHNVNPYMIWALMLVESSFNPDSISIADALGLLQVIPRTGLKIAELFGAEDFGPFDLLEEDTSVEHGVFYFSRLVKKFHGQELFAFAGYNGGPHRVSGWLDMRGHAMPLDEFVEEIPFTESREYAKKVLHFLYAYLRIYEGYGEGIYVGQNMRTDYLEQPDF